MKKDNPGPFVDTDTVWEISDDIYRKQLKDVSNIEYHSVLNQLGWKRPWRYVPAFWSWENWGFQILHIINAIVTFGLVALLLPDSIIAHILLLVSVFIFAVVREYFQWRNWDWKVLMLGDRIFDVIGHLVGIELFWQIIK